MSNRYLWRPRNSFHIFATVKLRADNAFTSESDLQHSFFSIQDERGYEVTKIWLERALKPAPADAEPAAKRALATTPGRPARQRTVEPSDPGSAQAARAAGR